MGAGVVSDGVGLGAGVVSDGVGLGAGVGVVDGVGSGVGVVSEGVGSGVTLGAGAGVGFTEPSPSVPPLLLTVAVASSFIPFTSAWLVAEV